MDTDGDGIVTSGIRRRVTETGPRIQVDERDMYRFVAGLSGRAFGDMEWEAFYNFGRSEESQQLNGNISISRFQQGLLVDPANPDQCADPSDGCVVLNPFGENSLSQEMVDFLVVDAFNQTSVQQQQAGANLAGNVVDLPAGPLGIAIGAEYRKEEAETINDQVLRDGDVDGFSGGENTAGSFDVLEGYAEAIVPLLSGLPGADYFGLELGARFSDYSTAGSVWSYKLGGEWRPFEALKVRGLYQRAVRAPNILELYLGLSNTFPSAVDFCDSVRNPSRTAEQRDFCVELGVPEAVVDSYTQDNIQIETIVGGNPELFQETSDTWSIGAVYTPSSVPNLFASIDLYSIEIDNAIDVFGGGLQSTIDACAKVLSLDDVFCQALTAREADGPLSKVELLNQNIASRKTRGIDFAASYKFDVRGVQLGLQMSGTRLLKLTTQAGPAADENDCLGAVGVRTICGRANPKWRLTGRATLAQGPITASLRYRYIGPVTDERVALGSAAPEDLFIPYIDERHYVDLTLNFEATEGVDLYATVDNLFDRDPPLIGDASRGNFNTDAGTYDVLGRRFSVGFRGRF